MARFVDLQPVLLIDTCNEILRHRRRLDYRQRYSPEADRGVIRARKREVHQLEDRCYKAVSRPQRQFECRAHQQARLDARICVMSLPVRSTVLPVFQSVVLDPQRQAAPPAQACFIRRPVLHLEQHLGDVLTAIGVVFVLHWGGQSQKGNRILPSLQVKETQQRHAAPEKGVNGRKVS